MDDDYEEIDLNLAVFDKVRGVEGLKLRAARHKHFRCVMVNLIYNDTGLTEFYSGWRFDEDPDFVCNDLLNLLKFLKHHDQVMQLQIEVLRLKGHIS